MDKLFLYKTLHLAKDSKLGTSVSLTKEGKKSFPDFASKELRDRHCVFGWAVLESIAHINGCSTMTFFNKVKPLVLRYHVIIPKGVEIKTV